MSIAIDSGYRTLVPSVGSVAEQQRVQRAAWWSLYVQALLAAAVFGALGAQFMDPPFALAALALSIGIIVTIEHPPAGVFILAFFTLLGDPVVAPWYPFTKNFSSAESIMFVGDGLIISPFEVMLAVTAVGWLLHARTDPAWALRRGHLLWPLLAMTGFVVFGLINGVGTGGSTNVAFHESRPLFYLPAVYFLAHNLITTRRQAMALVATSMLAVAGQSLLALQHYRSLDPVRREALEGLTQHGAAIHLAALFVLLLAALLLKEIPGSVRFGLVVLAIPSLVAFVLAQRRAGFIALSVGVIMLAVFLFFRQRRTFWWFVPTVAVLATGYLAAFWNNQGALGGPAQAVKSVIAPGQLSAADQSSDLYRLVESYNIWFTIRAKPLQGIGFGQAFYRPARLPDLSFFVFFEYLPHNSILWFWMKTGYLGFVSLLFVMGRTIMRGARNVILVRAPVEMAVAITAVAYVVMFLVYAYVDIAWDVRSVVFLGICMVLCADVGDYPESEPRATPSARSRPFGSWTPALSGLR